MRTHDGVRARQTVVAEPLRRGGETAQHPLLRLQRQAGNQAVAALVAGRRAVAVQRDPSDIRTDYSHLDVTSAGAEIDDAGAFTGLSLAAYKKAQGRLGKKHKKVTEVATRIEMLVPKVKLAWDRLQVEQSQQAQGAQVLGVFTAPEWFFKRPGTPFLAKDKLRIIETFRSLSEQYTNLVLVPGTIVWSQGEGLEQQIRNTAFVVLNGHLVKTLNKTGDLGDTDSYYRRQRDPSTHDLPSREEITAAWQRGRTPADAGSVRDDPSAFDVGNVTFSVEICGDFGRAKADQAAGRAPASGIDVQILVSHGQKLSGGLLITKPGGIAVHNDASVGGVRGHREASVAPLPGVAAAAPTTKKIEQGDRTIKDLHLPPVPLPANTPAARRVRAGVYVDRVKSLVHGLRTEWDQTASTIKGDVKKLKDEYRTAVKGPGGKKGDNAKNVSSRLANLEIKRKAVPKARKWLPGLDAKAQALPQGSALTSATADRDVGLAASVAQQAATKYALLDGEARDDTVQRELAVAARALQELGAAGLADLPVQQ